MMTRLFAQLLAGSFLITSTAFAAPGPVLQLGSPNQATTVGQGKGISFRSYDKRVSAKKNEQPSTAAICSGRTKGGPCSTHKIRKNCLDYYMAHDWESYKCRWNGDNCIRGSKCQKR